MVRDPWLHALRASSGAYLLTELRPVSIRDQVVRGVHLADRLIAGGKLNNRRLCVIGAGLAGMAAALHAARSGVDTVVFERENSAFPLQTSTRGRWLDPVHYDWPAYHYSSGLRPLSVGAPITPLSVFAGTPNVLGFYWDGELQQLTAGLPNLDVRLSTTVGAVNRITGGFSITHTGNQSPEDFGVLVFAVGRIGEDTSISGPSGRYIGQPFWSADRLLRFRSPSNRILISGGGDGGLQDYLRAVLKREDFSGLVQSLRLPSDVLHLVQSSEDRAFRDAAWDPRQPALARPARAARCAQLSGTIAVAVQRALRFPHVGRILDQKLRVGQPVYPEVNLGPVEIRSS